MTPTVAPLVSAISVMLAAYAFFFNAYKDTIEAGEDIGVISPDEVTREAQRRKVSRGRAASGVLAIIPLLAWAVFLPEVIDKIEAWVDAGFALRRYSALDVAFVILANAWLAVGIVTGFRAVRLHEKLAEFAA